LTFTTVGIVGSSGSGKTTMVDLILGLLWPSTGKLLVDEAMIGAHNVRPWQLLMVMYCNRFN